MPVFTRNCLLLLGLMLPLLIGACGTMADDDDNDAPQSSADDDNDNDENENTMDAVSSATPGVNSMRLTADHAGWKNAGCTVCHADAHDQGFIGASCVTCHGPNGASTRPAGHANGDCSRCHTDAHTGIAYRSPSDCRMCHGYEEVASPACASTEDFDVVIIGAGGGGLAAAAKLARNGLSVAVLEQHYKIGGCIGTFQRGDYTLEIGLHAMDALDPPDGMNRVVFEQLGIIDKITPLRLDPLYVAVWPGIRLAVPADVEEYRQVLKDSFPEESANIDRLWDDMAGYDIVFGAINNIMAGTVSIDDLLTIVKNLNTALNLLKLKSRTVSQMLTDYTSNEPLMAIWTQLGMFLGVDMDNLSALMFTVMWNNYHRHGCYYIEGGSGAVTDAMAQVVEENGGTIRLGARATKIDIEGNRAVRVRTLDDGCYSGRYIVSNANAPDTLHTMVGAEHLPADYLNALDDMTIGLSTFTVYLGVDHDYRDAFDGSHEIYFSDTYNAQENMEAMLLGDIERVPGAVVNYSAVDPTLAPAGKNTMQLTAVLPYDWENDWHWHEDYGDYIDLKTEAALVLIERAEQFLPGLSEHIEIMEVGTPRTVEGYTLNPRGTIFGWHHTVAQTLEKRLPNQTPIDNLFLAGMWTQPGAGQTTVIQSGANVAKMILDREGR